LIPVPHAALAADGIRSLPSGSSFRFAVAGTSMTPCLVAGDQVTARRLADAAGLRLGDLAVFDEPGVGPVVHRLMWRRLSVVRTRGDGSACMDAPVPAERLLGRVERVERAGRDVTPGGLRRTFGWITSFTAAAAHRLRRRAHLALAGGRA
jgi:hypothetical protein